MVQGSSHLRPALESRQPLPVLGKGLEQHLEGYFSPELCVPGTIDLALAPNAEQVDDLEGP